MSEPVAKKAKTDAHMNIDDIVDKAYEGKTFTRAADAARFAGCFAAAPGTN